MSFTAKVLINGTMLLYLFNDMPSKVQAVVICLCSSHSTGQYEQQRPGATKLVDTLRTSCRQGQLRGFGALNSSLHSRIFTSLSDGSSPRSYLFTSATGRIGVHTTAKYGTKPIRYVTLYFRDRLGAASPSVPVCEQKPYTV